MKKILISAPKSGSGKTSFTIALLKSLKERGIKTVSFKAGPDYIDPLFHKKILGIPSYNLDTYFTEYDVTLSLFEKHSTGYDISVIEGAMGLFDGTGGMGDKGSAYDLARVTGSKIILVIDAKGACRSLLPVISGFLSYDTEHLIYGIVLNRCTERVYYALAPEIEKLGVCALGYMRDRKDVILSSRHLGLTTPEDLEGINDIIKNLYEEFSSGVSLEKLLKSGDDDLKIDVMTDELLSDDEKSCCVLNNSDIYSRSYDNELTNIESGDNNTDIYSDHGNSVINESINIDCNCTIAVARDDAFCFIYEDNLDLLKKYGAKIIFFSPLSDDEIPSESDALYLPGGYPELHAAALSENKSMLRSIKNAYDNSMPFFAECGGFMYLHRSLQTKDGDEYEMAGVIDSKCFYEGRLVRFGYVELKENVSLFLSEGESIKGHEFHYYESEMTGDSCTAFKPSSATEYPCIITNSHAWMGFPHLYFPSNPSFAKSFVDMASKF